MTKPTFLAILSCALLASCAQGALTSRCESSVFDNACSGGSGSDSNAIAVARATEGLKRGATASSRPSVSLGTDVVADPTGAGVAASSSDTEVAASSSDTGASVATGSDATADAGNQANGAGELGNQYGRGRRWRYRRRQRQCQ